MPIDKISQLTKKVVKKAASFYVKWDMDREYKSKGIILNYHRIINLSTDPWTIAVSPDNFCEQLTVLKQHCVPIPLDDLNHPKKLEKLESPWVVITFDDGYMDNVHTASKILKEYQMPATFFLSSGLIGCQKLFWWDELTQTMLEPGVLPEFREDFLLWNLTKVEWDLAAQYTQEDYTKHHNWVYYQQPPTPRHKLFLKLYLFLRLQSAQQREHSLKAIKTFPLHQPSQNLNNFPLTLEDAKSLSGDVLFDIGAHAITHQDFVSLSWSEEKREPVQAKADLEALLNVPVTSFAYPYGSYQPSSVSAVKKAGFSLACTTKKGVIEHTVNRFLLPRIPVENLPGKEFELLIQKFLAC